MKIGIVGLPNVGKSTLFNALTRQSVPAENYPFCTIDPSVGIVPVPDARLDALAKLSASKKVIPAVVEFVDIAGLVAGAASGEGLGNKFLAHIREVDAIAEVVRVFDDPNVIHVSGAPDPLRDIGVINLELVLADLETVSKRIADVSRDAKRGDKEAVLVLEELLAAEKRLKDGQFASRVRGLDLLTTKPFLYVLNAKQGAPSALERDAVLKSQIPGRSVVVDAGFESELARMSPSEAAVFRIEFGTESGFDELVRVAYETLGLITFFTTGPDETRAWTIHEGDTAPLAGAAIHTDFRDQFIRAEVVASADLIADGSYGVARERAHVRTEGKEYIVKDGDVIEFRI